MIYFLLTNLFRAQIIETVNEGCNECLSADGYSLPRIKQAYKGENPQYLMNFVFKTRKLDTPTIYRSAAANRQRSMNSKSSRGKKRAIKRTKLASVPEDDENADETDSAEEVTSGEDKTHKRAEKRLSSASVNSARSAHSEGVDAASAGSGASGGEEEEDEEKEDGDDGAAEEEEQEDGKSGDGADDATSQASKKSSGSSGSGGSGRGLLGLSFRKAFSAKAQSEQSSKPPARPAATGTRGQSSAFRLFGGGADSSGGQLVTADMIEFYKELSISKELVDRLKHSSIRTPQVLLGWQLVVVMEAGKQAGV